MDIQEMVGRWAARPYLMTSDGKTNTQTEELRINYQPISAGTLLDTVVPSKCAKVRSWTGSRSRARVAMPRTDGRVARFRTAALK